MQIREHASPKLLAGLLRGELSPGVALVAEAHLELCDACRQKALQGSCSTIAAEASGRPKPAWADISTLRNIPFGRESRVSRGVALTSLLGVSGLGESVHVLNAAREATISLCADAEFALVLSGSVEAAGENYEAGDLLEGAGDRLADARALSACHILVVSADELYGASFLERLMRRRY